MCLHVSRLTPSGEHLLLFSSKSWNCRFPVDIIDLSQKHAGVLSQWLVWWHVFCKRLKSPRILFRLKNNTQMLPWAVSVHIVNELKILIHQLRLEIYWLVTKGATYWYKNFTTRQHKLYFLPIWLDGSIFLNRIYDIYILPLLYWRSTKQSNLLM